MVGPSATGSLKGTPSSMMSAPASARASSSAAVSSSEGNPAVMYGISARRPAARHASKRAARGSSSDEIVGDPDAIRVRIDGLDDGALCLVRARLCLGQIDRDRLREHYAVLVRNDLRKRLMDARRVRVTRRHHDQLV